MRCIKCIKRYNKQIGFGLCEICLKKSINKPKIYAAKYRKAHRNHYNKLGKEYRDQLSDSYIRRLIVDKSTILEPSDIPQVMVDAKRNAIKLKRFIRENKHG